MGDWNPVSLGKDQHLRPLSHSRQTDGQTDKEREREIDKYTDTVVSVVVQLKSGETGTRVVSVCVVTVMYTPAVLVLTLVVIYSHTTQG